MEIFTFLWRISWINRKKKICKKTLWFVVVLKRPWKQYKTHIKYNTEQKTNSFSFIFFRLTLTKLFLSLCDDEFSTLFHLSVSNLLYLTLLWLCIGCFIRYTKKKNSWHCFYDTGIHLLYTCIEQIFLLFIK